MSEEKKYFDLSSYMTIETTEENMYPILEELTDALVQIVERRGAYCAGGFSYSPCDEKQFRAPESKL